MAMKHPGFKSAQASIEKREGVSHAAAGRILAAGARKASPAAKKKNPRLSRVAGMGSNMMKAANDHDADDAGDHEYR